MTNSESDIEEIEYVEDLEDIEEIRAFAQSGRKPSIGDYDGDCDE